jgi:hypothetical protein
MMKWYSLLSVLAVLLLTLSCGGGGGGSSSGGGSSPVPQISLSLDKTTIQRGELLNGTISWSDSDGDITTVYIENWYGPIHGSTTVPASQWGINGTAGTAQIHVHTSSTASTGIHTFKFYMQQSNIVEINITATAKGYAMDKGTNTPFLITGGVR